MRPSTFVFRRILLGCGAVMGLMLAPTLASAQQTGTVQGRVVDQNSGQPLSSAQISVEGTGVGGLTNAQGRFLLLNVPAGQRTVQAVLIGYGTAEQAVTVQPGQTATVNLSMATSALEMNEIVVTGTGQPTERRRLSADVAVVAPTEVEASAANDVTQLLQGKIPGAQINATSASPGTAGLMSFRGVSSAMADQTPVIYIDGVRVDNARGIGSSFGGEQTSALADLAVGDIDHIEVTKGGAASTLYGADAANGVIQIFTKRGGAGQSHVTARMEQGYDAPDTKFIQDVDFVYPESKYPEIRNDPAWDPNFTKNRVLKSGQFQSYYLSAVGGNGTLGYNVSGEVENDTGVQWNNESTQYTLHSGVQATLSNSFSADFSGTYLRHDYHRVQNGTCTNCILTDIEVGDFFNFAHTTDMEEALAAYKKQDIHELVDRYTLSTSLTYNPSSLLNVRGTIGLDKRVSSQRHTEDIDFVPNLRDHGVIQVRDRDFTGLTLDLRGTLTYDAPFFTSTSTTVGFQGFRNDEQTTSANGTNLPLPGVKLFNAAALITAGEGRQSVYNGGVFFLQQAGIADMLFLEGGVRFDGNTAFGSNVSYQAYPKVGASFDLAGAGLAPGGMQTLRLRANYGVTGQFPPPFLRDRTFSASPFRGESAPRFDNPGNPDLEPERVSTIEGGLDAAFWNQRVSLGVTAYQATTTHALFFVNEQPSSGLGSQLRNVGEIRNRGLELQANLDLIHSAAVNWSLALNWSKLDNKVLSTGGLPPFDLSTNGRRMFGHVQEGYPVGVRFMGHPVDTNGDGLYDSSERAIITDPKTGKPLVPFPTSNGSISTQIGLPGTGLSFSAQGDWSRGASVQDYAAIWSYFNDLPRIVYPTKYDLNGNDLGTYPYLQAMNYFLVKGDFFKIRTVSVSYELPERFAQGMGASRASLSLSARNVYTWVPTPQSIFNPDNSRPTLLDPELAGYADPTNSGLHLPGSQSVALPPPHMFRFGIQVTF